MSEEQIKLETSVFCLKLTIYAIASFYPAFERVKEDCTEANQNITLRFRFEKLDN